MWWAGWSAPARFANPAVLILAIPCAVAWSRIQNRGSRAVAAGAARLHRRFCRACSSSPTADGSPTTRARRRRCGWTGRRSWRRWPTALPVWFRGREGAFAIDIGVWVVAFALAWWCARALAGSAELPRTRPSADGRCRGSHHRGHARGHALSGGFTAWTACWPRQPSSTSCAAWQRSRERSPSRSCRPVSLAVGRLLEMLPLEPAVLRGAGGRGPQRPDDRRPAGDSGWPLSGARRGRRVRRHGDARDRAGSVRVAERGDRLAGPADRDRVSRRRPRAHRPRRRRRAPRRRAASSSSRWRSCRRARV